MYAGIDFSMSSPGVVIGNSNDPKELHWYGLKQTKKQASSEDWIVLDEYPTYTSNEERYFKLANHIMSKVLKHGVTKVFLEGYAYGANGNVFNIGEATGILKHLLWLSNIPFETVAPNLNKKAACGKGNANKTLLYDTFLATTQTNLCDVLGLNRKGDKIPSPVDDLVDAYYLLQYGLSLDNSNN